jgi:hypothetical protein
MEHEPPLERYRKEQQRKIDKANGVRSKEVINGGPKFSSPSPESEES